MSITESPLTYIELRHLVKKFGALTAVNDVSLTVRRGDVLGFLGPNGAGKTTTMRLATGFLTPDQGSVKIKDVDMQKTPIEAKRLLGYLPEGSPSYGEMTVKSFLNFICDVRRLSNRAQAIDQVIEKTSLARVWNQTIDTLSKGYKRRVGIAQALIHDPPILILDEPTDGLDPNQKHDMRGLIKAMAKDKAIIISTHILEEVEAVCSRATIISDGKIMADGTPELLKGKSKTLDEEFRKLTGKKDAATLL